MKPALFLINSACAALLLTAVAGTLAQPAANSSAMSLGNVGTVEVDAAHNIITRSQITYTDAHMRTENGATLVCDQLVGDLNATGQSFKDCIATGNVVARVVLVNKETYDISADKAVYHVAQNEIDLTGKVVKAVATTPYTQGPLVQTGDSGVVLLGPSPKYPDVTVYPTILMDNVHTEFTPAQEMPATHGNTRKKPGQGVQGP